MDLDTENEDNEKELKNITNNLIKKENKMIDDIFDLFKTFPTKVKISYIIGIVGKLLVYFGILVFSYMFSSRFFTDAEKTFLFVVFVGYILNNWGTNEFKRYKKMKGY